MRKPYCDVELPSWAATASKEQLLDHLRYLTHCNKTLRSQLGRARRRYTKAEKELKANETIS